MKGLVMTVRLSPEQAADLELIQERRSAELALVLAGRGLHASEIVRWLIVTEAERIRKVEPAAVPAPATRKKSKRKSAGQEV